MPDARQLAEMDRLIVAAIDTPSPRATVQQLDAVTAMLPASALQPVVNPVLPDFNDELRKLAPLSKQLEESDLSISWYMFHIKALVAILNRDINQYVEQVAQASRLRTAQSHRGAALHQRVYQRLRGAGADHHRLRLLVYLPQSGLQPDGYLKGNVAPRSRRAGCVGARATAA